MIEVIRTYRAALAARADEERGATAVEYGLMVALIAVVIIAAVAALGGVLQTSFADTCGAINNAAETPAVVAAEDCTAPAGG